MPEENNKKNTIGTHSGTFHCDEVLACELLRRLSIYENAEIIRSRDMSVLNECTIVVDVGGVYNHDTKRYDHHQSDFSGTFDDKHEVKLSSAGLVYKHYGREVISNLVGSNVDDENVELTYKKVYDDLIVSLDAIDNGVDQYPESGKPLYCVKTDLSSRVSRLNPKWNEDDHDMQERFYKAMKIVGEEFNDFVLDCFHAWLPARQFVLESINNRLNVHESGSILRFDQFVPWKGHLRQLEDELKLGHNKIKYVLYTDWSGKWRIQCVPSNEGSFGLRKALPEEWRGVRNSELSTLTGIDGCIFVHASGFIGGNETYEGVLQMAVAALASNNSQNRRRRKAKNKQ